MGVNFRTQGTRDVLHLNNFNGRELLDVFRVDHSRGLNGSLRPKDVVQAADRYLNNHPIKGGRPPIDWSRDAEIGDIAEGVRRLRSLANRSKTGVLTYE